VYEVYLMLVELKFACGVAQVAELFLWTFAGKAQACVYNHTKQHSVLCLGLNKAMLGIYAWGIPCSIQTIIFAHQELAVPVSIIKIWFLMITRPKHFYGIVLV